MRFYPDKVYHVYNRGNNSQPIFFTKDNYLFFLRKIRADIQPNCDILAYCLMPNHYHLLLKPNENGCTDERTEYAKDRIPVQALIRKLAVVQSSYTRAIQKQENIKGSLFQQQTKAKLLDASPLPGANSIAICLHYIHQNPLKAGLVKSLNDWEFSSYADYAGLRNGTLCNKELAMQWADINLETFVRDSHAVMREEVLEKVLY